MMLFHWAQAQTIAYKVVYDTDDCHYEAYAEVTAGARTFPNTIPFPSAFSIVVPAALVDAPITVTESINPPNLQWINSSSIYQPEVDVQHDFHAFTITGGSGTNAFPNLEVGSNIHLFSFEVPEQLCEGGIRPYRNGEDPASGEAGMKKIDFTQSFKVFPNIDLYQTNNDDIATDAPAIAPVVSCTQADISLMANARPSCFDLSFEWSGPGAFSSTEENLVIPITENPAAQIGTYTLTVTDENGCSVMRAIEVAEINCFSALPVKLLTFDGKPMEDHNLLSWVTEREVENLYFEVERSKDGIHFESVAKVDGKSDGTTLNQYTAKDEAPFALTYYRLKQVDLDGTASFSHVIQITRKGAALHILDLYPNPVVDLLNLVVEMRCIASPSSASQFRITDVAGKVLHEEKINNNAGINKYTFDTTSLPSGVYFVKIINDHHEVVKRFVVENR